MACLFPQRLIGQALKKLDFRLGLGDGFSKVAPYHKGVVGLGLFSLF